MAADLKNQATGDEAPAGGLKQKLAKLDRKRLYTAVAALAIAGAAGHIMQRGAEVPGTGSPRLAATEPTPAPQPPIEVTRSGADPLADMTETGQARESVADLGKDVPVVEEAPEAIATEIAPVDPPQLSNEEPMRLAAADGLEETGPLPERRVEPLPLADDCEISVDATALPGALVALSVSAPCYSGEEVAFDQLGLRFTELLGPTGDLAITVPAMADEAIFIATFADGTHQSASVLVTDLADYARVALVWQGATGLQLHALEGDAAYGDAGHVWAEAPSLPSQAIEGKGGFVTVLGSSATGYAADVYTYPETLMSTGSTPEVSIEAQVTETTCDRRIEGSYLHVIPGNAPEAVPVTMAEPGCDAVGEYLVLKNLPQDLKLARN